jgi:hypothetical protein
VDKIIPTKLFINITTIVIIKRLRLMNFPKILSIKLTVKNRLFSSKIAPSHIIKFYPPYLKPIARTLLTNAANQKINEST